MKKRIVAAVLLFIGSALILTYGICAIFPCRLLEIKLHLICIFSISAGISAVLLFTGGILVLKDNKFGFIAAIAGLIMAFSPIIPLCFTYAATDGLSIIEISKYIKSTLLACRIIAPIIVATSLVIMPKFKGALYSVNCFFALLSSLFLGWAALYKGVDSVWVALMFVFGALGAVVAGLGGGISQKNGERAFSLSLFALLIMAGQFIFACAMCTQMDGIIHMLLAFCGLILAIIGGVLIVDTNESGFIVVAFGIISLLVWVLYTMFMLDKAIALGLISVMVSVILSAASVLKSRVESKR